MKQKLILYITLLCFQLICFAQNIPQIQTDRPDQTECPFITPKQYFQLENGFSYEQNNKNSNTIIAPTILTRYGINKFIELRLITEYVISDENSINNKGINPVLLGFKMKLFEEKGLIPTTSLITHIGLPKAASQNYRANYYYPEFRFTMQHTISEKQSISYNLGAEWNGVNTKPTYIYTLTSGYSLTEKLGVYIELFGFIPQTGVSDHRSDLGLTYLINSNHQFDISGGFGFSKISPDYYLSLGYSFRFKT